MIRTKTRNFMLAVLAAVLAFTIAVAGTVLAITIADNVAAPLEPTYMVGETVRIPSKTAGGVTSDETIVYFPSGLAQRTDSVSLTEAGKYTVEYRANGKRMTEENAEGIKEYVTDEFVAVRSLYSFSGSNSTAYYGEDNSQYDTGKTALNIQLAQGETLTFEKTFNINELEGNFFNFYVTPTTKGVYDVHDVWIILTDVYDSNNYITIKLQAVTFQGQEYVYLASYVLAAHNEEVLSGLVNGDIQRNSRFGAGVYLSLYGNGDIQTQDSGTGYAVKDSFAAFNLDNATKQLFVSGQNGTALIVDFDDPAYFANVWKGFTTGDVRLSVYGGGYTGSVFNLNITSVGDLDLSAEKAEDTVAPEITVDLKGYDENALPNGVVGQKYTVFDAIARDAFDGMVNVDVSAYYGYKSDNYTEIDIKDGAISTARPGRYAMVYSATDATGNTAVKEVSFYVSGDPNEIEITLGDKTTTAKVGEAVAIASYETLGGVGEVSVDITIDKEHRLGNGTFIPMEVGTFTVTYTATDLAHQVTEESYTVTVEANSSPVVIDYVGLPKYVLAGYSFKFPAVKAFDFNLDKYVETTLKVNDTACEDNRYLVNTADAGKDLSVKYIAKNASGADCEVYTSTVRVISVLDSDGFIQVQNYWVGDGFAKSADSDNVIFNATGTGDATVEYAKAMLYKNFSLTLRFNEASNNFDALNIKITDVDDPDKTLTIGLVNDKAAKRTLLTINGNETGSNLSGGFYSDMATGITITDGILSDGKDVNIPVNDKFDCTKMFVEITAKGITGAAEFKISEYCSQPMNDTVIEDLIGPSVIYPEYQLQFALNDVLTVGQVITEDSFDTDVTVTVTVTRPDSTKLYDAVPCDRDYTVNLDKYGMWVIVYNSTDSMGRNTRRNFTIEVVNTVKPVITVQGSVPTKGNVGKAITLPSATATDDIDGTVTVRCMVYEPTGTMRLADAENKFTPKVSGVHRVRYYALDNDGNMAISEYLIYVEA